MRKFFQILILSLVSFKATADFYEDRGFKSDSCYQHIVNFKCNNSYSICGATLFQNSPGSLSFSVSNIDIVKNKLKALTYKETTYLNTKFKLEKNKKSWQAFILEASPMSPSIVARDQKEKNFMSHNVKCN